MGKPRTKPVVAQAARQRNVTRSPARPPVCLPGFSHSDPDVRLGAMDAVPLSPTTWPRPIHHHQQPKTLRLHDPRCQHHFSRCSQPAAHHHHQKTRQRRGKAAFSDIIFFLSIHPSIHLAHMPFLLCLADSWLYDPYLPPPPGRVAVTVHVLKRKWLSWPFELPFFAFFFCLG